MSVVAPVISHRHLFGLRADVASNIHFVDEAVVLYVAGHNVVVYNTETKAQRFIHGSDSASALGRTDITAIALSPNKRFVAIAERGERAVVTVYDVHTLRKRKVLSTAQVSSGEFVALSFSPDNKWLLTQGGAPDWTVVNWQWEKVKPLQFANVTTSSAQEVTQVSFCPSDQTLFAVSGRGILKQLKIQEEHIQASPIDWGTFTSSQDEFFTGHTWIDESLFSGTSKGSVVHVQNGEYYGQMPVPPSPGSATRPQLHSILAFSKGFVCGSSDGLLHIFEKVEEQEFYERSKVLSVGAAASSTSSLVSASATPSTADALSSSASKSNARVNMTNLAISPSEDLLTCTSSTQQAYLINLSNLDVAKADDIKVESLLVPFHTGRINGMDVAIRKPLVVTAGRDRTIRVWNYMEKTVELCKTFAEEPHSVSFHPSGLHIVVGFTDKLRLMNLLMDDIRTFKEFPIKACKECRFSNGGQHLAAVSGNQIIIFNTYSAEVLATLRGHNQKIKSLFWNLDDSAIISAGSEGAVYEWQVHTAQRSNEYVQRGCVYNSALCTTEGKIYCVGSDQVLKEIVDSNVEKEMDVGTVLTQVVISHPPQRMLFASTSSGIVRSFKFPLTGDCQDYQCHSGEVTRMQISRDDQFLFTCSEDGCLAVFEIREKEGRVAKRKELSVAWSEEILVTTSDLEEKNALMNELKNKVDELTLHNDYQLRLREMNYQDKLKEKTDKFNKELQQHKQKYEVLKDEKQDMEMEYEERIKTREDGHAESVQDAEVFHQKNLMSEVERYHHLERAMKQAERKWEEDTLARQDEHADALEDLQEGNEVELEDKRSERERLQEDLDQILREFHETKQQLEEDFDLEIEELHRKQESQLSLEREATLRLKGENGVMKKKFAALQNDIEDQREEIKVIAEKEEDLKEQIGLLENKIDQHKLEITRRDTTIGEKEKKIYELKKKNQTLEKHKFVLDYRIKELKRQIEPRQTKIGEMKQQVKAMDAQLEQFHKENGTQQLSVTQLNISLEQVQADIRRQRTRHRKAMQRVEEFGHDLHEVVAAIQDPQRLQQLTRDFYAKHMRQASQDALGLGEIDPAINSEYGRQREFLDESVDSLKRKLASDMRQNKHDNMRVMQENVVLIKETNQLRKQLRDMQMMQRDEALFGQTQNKKKRTQRRAASSAASSRVGPPRPPSRSSVGSVASGKRSAPPLKPWQRELKMQREQLSALRDEIDKLQRRRIPRPQSRERLPPLDDYSHSSAAVGVR